MSNPIPQFPHCDPAILHAPGECKYCDAHPDWQQLREIWHVDFTGKTSPDKTPCPSTWRREIDKVHAWHGNRPVKD